MRCGTCKTEKTADDFNWKNKAKGVKQKSCRMCQRACQQGWYNRNGPKDVARVLERRKRMRQAAQTWIKEYLTAHPCVDCGETDQIVLDFDHVRGEKTGDVSRMVYEGYSLLTIQQEVAKCEIRCANDHRRVTARRRLAVKI